MNTLEGKKIRKPRTDESPLWDSIFGNIGYSAVLVAHDLKLFALLAKRPHRIREIAAALNIADRPSEALLAACVSLELVQANKGNYTLTTLAEDYLLESSPTYFGGFLDLLIANDRVFSFDSLKKAVLTNSSQVYGDEALFTSHEAQVALARAFTHGMQGHSAGAAFAWPEAMDLSGYHAMLDVGGGSGIHAIGAAIRWPDLQAIVFDLPPVCEVAAEYIARYGLSERIKTHPGDMWQDPFPPADVHFYADIYHDWSPEKCRLLTQKSYESLKSGGCIILHEVLFDDSKTGPFAAAAYSVAMLLWTEGQQHSGGELRTMLMQAGFTDIEVKSTFGYWNIVTGRKP